MAPPGPLDYAQADACAQQPIAPLAVGLLFTCMWFQKPTLNSFTGTTLTAEARKCILLTRVTDVDYAAVDRAHLANACSRGEKKRRQYVDFQCGHAGTIFISRRAAVQTPMHRARAGTVWLVAFSSLSRQRLLAQKEEEIPVCRLLMRTRRYQFHLQTRSRSDAKAQP